MAEIADLLVNDASNVGRFPEGQKIPTFNNGARALEGMIARYHKDRSGVTLTTGSATAYAISTNAAYPEHTAGMVFMFRVHVANTGTATLTVNSLDAKPLRRQGGGSLLAGDLDINQIVHAAYNAAGDYYECIGVGHSGSTNNVDPFVELNCVNGANTDLVLPAGTNFYIEGPTGVYTISGFTGGVDGRLIRVFAAPQFALTIANNATSAAANRILTLTGSDITTTTQGAFTFIYSATSIRWVQFGNQT